MLQVTGPRVKALNAYMYRREGLDDSTLEHSQALLVDALQEGNFLTRKQLSDMF